MDVVESWHNNPHLKRGDELEIKFITVASEDMANTTHYLSFHFMKLQRPDQRASTYIKAQETKPALVVYLMEDEGSTRRAWGVWGQTGKIHHTDRVSLKSGSQVIIIWSYAEKLKMAAPPRRKEKATYRTYRKSRSQEKKEDTYHTYCESLEK
ncbi:hypothetical protein ACS0TY_028612 [Phlomoides rotata]